MLRRGSLVFLFVFSIQFSLASAQKLVYREQTGKRVENHTYVIEPQVNGYRVVLSRKGDGVDLSDECEMDASFSTVSWKFSNPAEKTEVNALRNGNTIVLSGIHEGKSLQKTFRINNRPWKQLFSIDFISFVQMKEVSSGFWSLGTAGMGDMKIAEFSVNRGKTKTIQINSELVEAVCLRIALKGLRSIFWHGDYWMRKADGRYLLYEGRNGLFSAMTRKELVSEE